MTITTTGGEAERAPATAGDERWVSPQDWQATTESFLTGQYEPVTDERDDVGLEVVGRLPSGLRGSFMRNGGNPFFAPRGRYHIFDGDGMLHGVHLDGEGGARYSNRWVRSRGLRHERDRGHGVFGGLSEFTMPDQEAIDAAGMFKNTANTNVVRHAGRCLALMEGDRPTEVDLDLRTIGEFDFDGRLEGAMTAHPKVDPVTGELLFFGYSLFPPFLRYHVAAPDGTLVRSTEVPIPRGVMIHDFAVTATSVVWFDLPAVFDPEAMMSGGAGILWRPEHGARIGVMPRDGEGIDTTWIDVDPFFVFHFMNAWDDDGRVVVDGCRASAMATAFGDEPQPTADVTPTLWRWEIDPATGVVRDHQLDDRVGDFPRINDARTGLPNRFGAQARAADWGEGGEVIFDGVIWFDHSTGSSTEHVFGRGRACGEPVFAADPDGLQEDDGWILTFVSDLAEGTSELVVLDAHDITREPVARVLLPRRVPFGFHGNWMPAEV